MIEPTPPKELNSLEFVWSYHNELRIFFRLNDGIKYTKRLKKAVQEYKVRMLEFKLGYRIKDLEELITHKEYEKQVEKGLITS